MADDPKFVKLANRLARGSQTDLNTGFGISGLDIVPFPEDSRQARHVRDGLRRGVYEAAEADEVKAFKNRETDYLGKLGLDGDSQPVTALPHQEGQIQALAREDREQIEGSRGLGVNSKAAYAADQARRNAVLEASGGKPSKQGSKDDKEAAKAAEAEAEAAAEAAKAAALTGASQQANKTPAPA